MRTARLLAIGCLAAAAAAGPALAGTRVTFQNYFHEDLDLQNCSGTTSVCAMVSAKLPASKHIRVSQVSCTMETTSPLKTIAISETSAPLGTNTQFVPFLPATSIFVGNRYVYTFVQPLEFVARAGRYVRVIATAAEGTTFIVPGCQITGSLVTP